MTRAQADTLVALMFKWIGSPYDYENPDTISTAQQITISKVAAVVVDTVNQWHITGHVEDAQQLNEAYLTAKIEYLAGRLR